MNYVQLSLGEKINLIRKSKGLSLENLAHATGCNISTISRIEKGERSCSDDILAAIKTCMEIENAPLHDYEVDAYKDRLNIWEDLAHSGRLVEARAMQEELFPIHELPYEKELAMQYAMVDVMLLQKEGDMATAAAKIDEAQVFLDGVSDKLHIAYLCNKAYMISYGNKKEAIRLYLHAMDLAIVNEKPVATIALNIGIAYADICQPHHALIYLERAKAEYKLGRIHPTMSVIDAQMATCYMQIGNYKKADKLFRIALAQSESVNYKLSSGIMLYDMGCLYIETGDAKEGIKYVDKALAYLLGHDKYMLEALFIKAYGLICLKMFAECEEVLTLAKQIISNSEEHTIQLETLSHIATLIAKKCNLAAEYLEVTALPYLANSDSLKFLALRVCDMLEMYYKKKRNPKRAAVFIAISRDIYRYLFMGSC